MTDTNPSDGLTSRPRENRGIIPVPRLHRAMPPGERTVPAALDCLPSATAAPDTWPCLNPACQGRDPESAGPAERSGVCTWPARGRPSYFCSSACREQYEYERAQLAEDIKALEEALDAPDGSYRDRRRVETELAKRRWGMQRYLFDSAQLTPSRKRRKGNA